MPAWKHGREPRQVYWVWMQMKHRCYNPKDIAYKNYGGRGIRVCRRWRNNFIAFRDDMGPRPEGTTIDRMDNDKNYEPGNCRWATRKEQSEHKRRNGKFLLPGKKVNRFHCKCLNCGWKERRFLACIAKNTPCPKCGSSLSLVYLKNSQVANSPYYAWTEFMEGVAAYQAVPS